MKLRLGSRALRLNIIAFVILFVGYLLTTGTNVIEVGGAKNVFRFMALSVFLANIAFQRSIKFQYVVVLLLLYAVLTLNQSQIAMNIVFLLLISASLNRLNGRELAVALLIPTIIVVGLHVLLLFSGQLTVQTTEFGGRNRSTLGFANANQVSAIYLSLVILSVFTHIQFKKKATMLLLAVSYGMASYVVLFTDSRTVIIALTLLIFFQVFGALFYRFKAYRASLILVATASPFFASAITYYLTTSANPALNLLLSLRPYFFSQFMRTVTPSDLFFGWQTIDDTGVDNMYLMLLSSVGAVGCFVVFICVSYLIFRMNPRFIPLVVVLLAISVFESFLLRPEIPISALFLHLLMSRVSQRSDFSRMRVASKLEVRL